LGFPTGPLFSLFSPGNYQRAMPRERQKSWLATALRRTRTAVLAAVFRCSRYARPVRRSRALAREKEIRINPLKLLDSNFGNSGYRKERADRPRREHRRDLQRQANRLLNIA
jgi:hypothetical protein